MTYLKKVFWFSSLIILGILSLAQAQVDSSKVDSSYEAYIQQAWDKFEESLQSDDIDGDSLQQHYSNKFYKYYLNNPNTPTGGKAFEAAFMMWGNLGSSEHINEALQTLDNDSPLWGKVINSVSRIYGSNEDIGDTEAYLELLNDLKDKLTHPESKSAVIYELLEAKMKDNKDEAKKLAQKLVEIDAAEFFVDKGLGYLHELESLNIGQQAPEFTAQTIEGKDISLSDLSGQFVLLDFWATWCGPCLPEIPHLKTLQNKYEDANFKIVGISLDRQKSDLTDFINERSINWPQIIETEVWDGEITELYNVVGIPRTYLIDPEGVIVAKDLRGEEMIQEIEKHMSK